MSAYHVTSNLLMDCGMSQKLYKSMQDHWDTVVVWAEANGVYEGYRSCCLYNDSLKQNPNTNSDFAPLWLQGLQLGRGRCQPTQVCLISLSLGREPLLTG